MRYKRPRNVFSASLLVIALAACRGVVEVSPPPPEERYQPPLPPPLASCVEMSRPDADRYIVSGVGEPAGESSRWAGPTAVLRFLAPPFLEVRFFMRFSLPELVMRKTGGVVVRVFIGEALFEERVYSEAGEHVIEKAVEAGTPRWDAETQVRIELAPRRPGGPAEDELRFLLTAAGFRP